MPSERSFALFGLTFGSLTMAETCELIALRARDRGGTVVTANVDHAVLLKRNAEFAMAYADAWLRLVDGAPVAALCRILRLPLRNRVTGADLLPALCASQHAAGLRVVLVGGSDGSARLAAERISSDPVTTVDVVGSLEPCIQLQGEDDTADTLARLHELEPDIVFVGLGTPKQEIWARRNAQCLPAGVVICCGAAIDFASGRTPRAPRWLRRLGLEWVYRLAREPGRLWRRYLLADLAFLRIAAGEIGQRLVKGWRR